MIAVQEKILLFFFFCRRHPWMSRRIVKPQFTQKTTLSDSSTSSSAAHWWLTILVWSIRQQWVSDRMLTRAWAKWFPLLSSIWSCLYEVDGTHRCLFLLIRPFPTVMWSCIFFIHQPERWHDRGTFSQSLMSFLSFCSASSWEEAWWPTEGKRSVCPLPGSY